MIRVRDPFDPESIGSEKARLFIKEVIVSKQITYLILILCLLAAPTGCAPAPDAPAQDSATPAEDTVEEESVPTDPPPPTETSIAEETDTEETDPEDASPDDQTESSPAMALTSPAFYEGEPIPLKFSCDGEEISPELDWFGLPDGTISLTLIFDDPDAPGGTWVHWVLFNIPKPDMAVLVLREVHIATSLSSMPWIPP